MSGTKWHRPIFSGPSPQSTIMNSGNGTNDNQRKTVKGDLAWDLRVGGMEQQGVFVLHPKEKGHPDMSFLFSKPSNRKHPNYTYPSPNSNGSSSDNIKQALPHHQQGRLIGSPARNKCLGRLSLLLPSLRLPVSTYKITNQDESRNSRKDPATAGSLIQEASFSWGSKLSSSAKRHQSKVAGRHTCMEILHILSFWLDKTLFRQSQQRPAGATTVLGKPSRPKQYHKHSEI